MHLFKNSKDTLHPKFSTGHNKARCTCFAFFFRWLCTYTEEQGIDSSGMTDDMKFEVV
jgi:hypothetical protein